MDALLYLDALGAARVQLQPHPGLVQGARRARLGRAARLGAGGRRGCERGLVRRQEAGPQPLRNRVGQRAAAIAAASFF